MLDDEEAEHLPGCNLAVTCTAFDTIGGFDPQFHTAGDDVDFCWRLRDAGFRLGFVPGAFVWHRRRPTIGAFLRQQLGYGRAEHLLLAKHPARFSKRGDAKWQGFIYGGGPVRVMADSIIYHGPMGAAGYQAITNRMLPLRELDGKFDSWKSRLALRAVKFIQPRLRGWARNRTLGFSWKWPAKTATSEPFEEYSVFSPEGYDRGSSHPDAAAPPVETRRCHRRVGSRKIRQPAAARHRARRRHRQTHTRPLLGQPQLSHPSE